MRWRAVFGAAFAVAAIAAPASAHADEPGHYGYSGTSDEFPVGTCINVTNGTAIDDDQLRNTIPVPCSTGEMQVRVAQQVAAPEDCAPPVGATVRTTDGVILCLVRNG